MYKSFLLLFFSAVLMGCSAGMASKSSCQIKGQGFCAPMSAIESWDEQGTLTPKPALLCPKGDCHVG